jgi:hypothetical protein
MHTVHIFPTYLFKIHSNFILSPTPRSYLQIFRLKFCRHRSSHARYMSRPCHPPWFDRLNTISWRAQVTKLLIMQSSPASHHFLPLRSKYSPQHSVLKYSQAVFFP